MKVNLKRSLALRYSKGFTLIELLVVVAIIGILAAVILASLTTARSKGSDAAVKSDLKNATSQAEVFYNTNTAAVNSYTGVCTDPGPVGGAKTVAAQVNAAAKAGGLALYTRNPVAGGAVGSATCNDSANAWAAEAPLQGAGANQMWCVDSIGKSKQENNLSILATTVCP